MTDNAMTKSGFSGASVVLAFLGGVLAGATAAIILAPSSGEETRRRLGDAVNRSGDAIRRTRLAAGEAARAARGAFAEAVKGEH